MMRTMASQETTPHWACFIKLVKQVWQKWLTRRNRERSLNWEAFARLAKQYPLPIPKIVHSIFNRKTGTTNT
ncbi:MAG: hypothetical protein FWH27_15900 [Planctomycetaceae bacterium]|nr:hypothetical protein [Planctomycetaceae bacterium]